uniref:ceramide glucosyltransferase n=1 Tax=Dunaliella tertiolecta TaxID=3047 RepID=A0A7S3VJX6_DUNTE
MNWKFVENLVYVQGIVLFLVASLGWWWAGIMRRRERLRRKTFVNSKKDDACHADSDQYPPVSLIMPVKGCRAHSEANWASHLSMQYDGPVEFLFVGESEADPAWPCLRSLAAQQQHLQARGGDQSAGSRTVRLHVSGLSQRCSQKIHNLASAALAASPNSRYLLFLDDDVECHPSTLQDLVGTLERDPSLFMATGYPFDIPQEGAGLPAYCMLVYHLALLIPFSAQQRATFVWGGCMLLRADCLRPHDRYGILQAWLDGGYSDDLILAAQCGKQGLAVATPSFAIFPQRLEKDVSWSKYWNYLRRQLFVLDTYANSHNRLVNYTMAAVSTYFCVAFCAAAALVAFSGLQLALCALQSWKSWSTDSSNLSSTTGLSFSQVLGLADMGHAPILVCVLLLALLLAHVGLHFMTSEVLQLLAVLSPARPPIPISSFHVAYLLPALLVQCVLMPCCLAYTLLQPAVVWSGTRYFKSKGKVVKIER